jgi:hypothetical protein
MRAKLLFVFVFALLSVYVVAAPNAFSRGGVGARPPMFTPQPTPTGPMPTSMPATPVPTSGALPGKARAAFDPVSFFGMNLYLTGLERSDDQASQLAVLAANGGVKWSREELSWANIEPNSKGEFNWDIYDRRLAMNESNGIQVIGMLLTTPRWASTNPKAGDWYWYEPSDYNDYYDFVRAAVNRWKGQIHVWEIWNEPDVQGTWNCLNDCDRAAKYAQLLAGAYSAVKSVDPDARVLIGGLSIHDYTNGGMAFLDQVVANSNGAINFDALSIHPYMPDRVPESMRDDSVVQNFPYRLNMVNEWINNHAGQPGEVWITEEGRSTCAGCPSQFSWSEDEQASMLARLYGIGMAFPRITHFSYFQFEDKFNNPADLYGGMSIVRDNLTTKPAYNAYRTASTVLNGATFVGMGPQMVAGNNPHQPDTSDYIAYDYRFNRGGTTLNMVWRVNDSLSVNYPVDTAQVDLIDRDGTTIRLTASNGTIPLTIGPRPQYVVSVGCGSRFSDVCPDHWAFPFVECMSQRGIISGYADGTFRPNNNVTRGQLSKIVSNAAGFNEAISGQTFEDVPPSSDFYLYVERMSSRGIIGGYPCGGVGEPCGAGNKPYFRLNAGATRGQIAKIVSNAKGYSDTPGMQTFQDVSASSAFYLFVERLTSRGIMGGYPCGGTGEPCGTSNKPYFRPNNNATRGQVSKIVTNTFFPECQGANR